MAKEPKSKISKKEQERRMVFARQKAAQAWCHKKTSKKEMDADLCEEFAKILVLEMYEPHLGCSKTSKMQEEIDVRNGREEATIEFDG